jgi:preprotein translocase subunit SecE
VARNRNRKRPRDRRPDRPGDAAALATARSERLEAPEPLTHATPDSELAEAQLALGRPDLAEVPDERELEELAEDIGGGGGGRRGGAGADAIGPAPGGAPASSAGGESLFARLLTFLQGSWHELQRVQWPDRRQVFQATGVVLGFVIVAGVFLGVADVVAEKVVNLILYGHAK